MVVVVMIVMRMKWRWLGTNAVAATAQRMRPVRATGSGRRSWQSRRKRMRNRRGQTGRRGRIPVVMMKRSTPREGIGWSADSSAGSGRNGRIKSVAGGSGEFGRRSFGRSIPQDAVDAGDARRRPVRADTFHLRNNKRENHFNSISEMILFIDIQIL